MKTPARDARAKLKKFIASFRGESFFLFRMCSCILVPRICVVSWWGIARDQVSDATIT